LTRYIISEYELLTTLMKKPRQIIYLSMKSFSVFQGEVIEEYSDDKPFPSCLIYGNTFGGDPVHSVWAYNRENQWAVLITVYRPDPQRWIDWRTRRPKDAPI